MTAQAIDQTAVERIEEALRFNPARLYTAAEARALMLGPNAPRDQIPTENWLSRQLGENAFESTKIGRGRYLTGEQVLKLIRECALGKYGLPVDGKTVRTSRSR